MRDLFKLGLGLLLLVVMPAMAFGDNCRAPARTLEVLAFAEQSVQVPLASVLKARFAEFRLRMQADAAELATINVAAMSTEAYKAFYAKVEQSSAADEATARRLASDLKVSGNAGSAQWLEHYANSLALCTAEQRLSRASALANGPPKVEMAQPIYREAYNSLVFACGSALVAKLGPAGAPAEGTSAFWQACSKLAVASAPRTSLDHFSINHAVAEPLCALSTAIPLPGAVMRASVE